MKEQTNWIPRLVVDGKGTERRIYPSRETPPPPVRPEIVTYEEALEWNKLAKAHSERALNFTQEYARVRCDPKASNRLLLVNISDLHWGNMDVDYDFLDQSLKTIEYTPNMVGVLGWNILDAAIPAQYPDGVMWSGQTAQEQVYTFKDKLETLYEKGKLIAAIGDASCHEGWLKTKTGWMIYRELFDGIDVPLLLNGGYLEIEVGKEVYRLALFHKTRYWSTFNKTHGGDRMMDRKVDAEIVFTAHMHQAAVGQTNRYSSPFTKETAVVSSGTCKLDDRWLRGRLGESGEKGFQGIILWADKHGFETVYDLDRGKELMVDAIEDEDLKKLQWVREELRKFSG